MRSLDIDIIVILGNSAIYGLHLKCIKMEYFQFHVYFRITNFHSQFVNHLFMYYICGILNALFFQIISWYWI